MATKSVRDVTGSGALINTVRSVILDFQESRPGSGMIEVVSAWRYLLEAEGAVE